VQRNTGLPQALVSGDDSQWSWKSINQLDEAVNELATGRRSQSSSSHASLSVAIVEAENADNLSQSVVNLSGQGSMANTPTVPI